MTSPLNPVSHCLSKNVVHVYRGCNCSLDTVVDDVIGHVFLNFTHSVVESDSDDSLISINPICPQYKIDNNNTIENESGTETIKIEPVPPFIENLPDEFWIGYPPECVVSHHDNDEKKNIEDETDDGEKMTDEKIVYRTVPYHEYSLTKREELFFDRAPHLEKQDHFAGLCYNNSTSLIAKKKKRKLRHVFIKGLCVMTICWCDGDDVLMVFHLDQILLACYNVQDIRMMYTNDVIFHQQLAHEIVSCLFFFCIYIYHLSSRRKIFVFTFFSPKILSFFSSIKLSQYSCAVRF